MSAKHCACAGWPQQAGWPPALAAGILGQPRTEVS